MQYRTCEYCGAALDPDEVCDCQQEPLPAPGEGDADG